jgi:hypothetical protein
MVTGKTTRNRKEQTMIQYQIYEAERTKTDAELREVARVHGQIAAAVSRLRADVTGSARALGLLLTKKGAGGADKRPVPVLELSECGQNG